MMYMSIEIIVKKKKKKKIKRKENVSLCNIF
jgi:hypothetical protein